MFLNIVSVNGFPKSKNINPTQRKLTFKYQPLKHEGNNAQLLMIYYSSPKW